jgi:hypothetical protein
MGTLTISEAMLSRRSTVGATPSCELSYLAWSTDNDETVRDEIAAAAPATYTIDDNELDRQSIEVEPIFVDSVNHTGQWKATVRYGAATGSSPKPEGTNTISFDTGGGTQHITQSLSTVQKYAPSGKTAPDCKGAIGVSHNGSDISVSGCDILVPEFRWTEEHVLPEATVTSKAATWYALTGKTNSSAWRGYNEREVRFDGCSGQRRGDGKWEITFRFSASPNRTGITIGSITGIAKKGWEYLWVMYGDVEDATAKRLTKQPIAAYVEKVLEDGAFADLGLGT